MSEKRTSGRDGLTAALAEARASLPAEAVLTLALMRELSERLEDAPPGRTELGAWLAATAGEDAERRASLADVVGVLANRLAPEDEPPAVGAGGDAWLALVTAADRLYGGGVHPLGRPAFVGERLLELLRAEAREVLPAPSEDGPRVVAPAGRVLARVAVSGKLRQAVAEAVGFPVVPTYEASYLYDPPGSHVRTHLDTREYELVVHLILEHELPADGSGGSALVVHSPGASGPTRLRLAPGELVALRGRGTIHSWAALRFDEHRTLTAIGFAPA